MRFFLLTLLLVGPFAIFGQQDATDSASAKPHISGSADVYYRYNIDAPGGSLNNFTKFTNTQNSFALGMVSVKAVDSFGKVNAVVNVSVGPRANEYNYTDANNSLVGAVKEMYLSYTIANTIKFTAGKWYKHIGYELPDANLNRNYSTSYSFTYGPMSYTGIRANIILAKKIDIMVGLTNPADITNLNYAPTKTMIAGIHFNAINNRLKVKLNFQGYGGISRPHLLVPGYYLYKSLQQYDAVLQYNVSNKLMVAYNGTMQVINTGSNKSWSGNTVYVTYKWKPDFDISLRGELLNDDDAVKIGTRVFAATLTGNIILGNRLRFIPEIRLDKSRDNIFQKGNVAGTGTTFTGLLAAVYSFGK